VLPVDESGVFDERAALRYLLQYESWQRYEPRWVCGYCVDGVYRVASPVLGEGLTLTHPALPSAGRHHDQDREKRVARYRP